MISLFVSSVFWKGMSLNRKNSLCLSSLAEHTTRHMWEFSSIPNCQIYMYSICYNCIVYILNWFLMLQVNYNGLLTFNIPLLASEPYYIPTRGNWDHIVPLWSDFSNYYNGVFSYQQYTNGSVLARATRDINQYFPQKSFTASWVFVVTWKYGPQKSLVTFFGLFVFSYRLYRQWILFLFFSGNPVSSGFNFRWQSFFPSDELWWLRCILWSSGGKTNTTGLK